MLLLCIFLALLPLLECNPNDPNITAYNIKLVNRYNNRKFHKIQDDLLSDDVHYFATTSKIEIQAGQPSDQAWNFFRAIYYTFFNLTKICCCKCSRDITDLNCNCIATFKSKKQLNWYFGIRQELANVFRFTNIQLTEFS